MLSCPSSSVSNRTRPVQTRRFDREGRPLAPDVLPSRTKRCAGSVTRALHVPSLHVDDEGIEVRFVASLFLYPNACLAWRNSVLFSAKPSTETKIGELHGRLDFIHDRLKLAGLSLPSRANRPAINCSAVASMSSRRRLRLSLIIVSLGLCAGEVDYEVERIATQLTSARC